METRISRGRGYCKECKGVRVMLTNVTQPMADGTPGPSWTQCDECGTTKED